MKNPIRFVLIVAMTLTMASAPSVMSATEKDEQTPLGARMETVSNAWRRLRAQVGDAAQNQSSLSLVAAIREATKDTEKMTPAKASEVPSARRAQFQAAYAESMQKFLAQLDRLQAALAANDNDAAAKIFAEINAFYREAHKEFRAKSERR